MNKIKVLSPDQAQKIAAGEVIERPVNVVKEVIENSIDAGATQVSLYIEKAGKQLIRVVDNGCGMSVPDAKNCFLSHATSKISNIDELESIESYGFRGEALASISAISKIKLITRPAICHPAMSAIAESEGRELDSGSILPQENASLGVEIEYENSRLISEKAIACNFGTDLQIHDLFYNIPVRKKFLKQDETEWNQVQTLFYAFCLSHTKIHFRLYNDGKLVLNAPPVSSIQDRTTQIWDHNFSQNLIELSDESKHDELQRDASRILPHKDLVPSWIKFSGCISNHNFWRYGRTHIFFFVNNRWVKNPELSKGLLKGYLNVLPYDKFPAAFIFIDIDKTLVDVNCHPKKEEVRFLKPVTVQNILQEIVKNTLAQNLSKQIAPGFMGQNFASQDIGNQNSTQNIVHEHVAENSQAQVCGGQPSFSPLHNIFVSTLFCHSELDSGSMDQISTSNPHLEPTQRQTNLPVYGQSSVTVNVSQTQAVQPESQVYKIIGQLFKTYILIENKDNFVMIDQHAAHERIIYENLLNNFEHKQGTRLLFPEILTLTTEQITSLLECKDFFSEQGIDFEVIGKNDITIKTSPPKISKTSLKELFMQAIEFIQENEKFDKEIFRKKLNEHMHSQISCKSAVKAGDELTFAQMHQLVDDLNKCENRIICVHGRPTTWVISKFEVEKNFKRR
ncbi:MAG: DNA mismatch repair endonuclease MutL [bacterium]